MRIACIGGLTLDVKARSLDAARSGTSNPATVTRAAGGVAANVARSLGHLGIEVALFSAVGDDEAGRWLRSVVAGDGVRATGIETLGDRTGTYVAVLDSDGSLVIGAADMTACERMDPAWSRRVASAAAGFELWIVDANIPAPALRALLEVRPAGITVLADPVSASKAMRMEGLLDVIDAIFPDPAEAAALAGIETADPEELAAALLRLGVTTAVVSLGAAGVLVGDRAGCVRYPALAPESIVDVTGAGDALLAGYAYGLATGGDPVASALAAASLVLESPDSVRSDLTPALLATRMS